MNKTEEHVLILFDSGVLKDRIAEMMDISRNEVDTIIDRREYLEYKREIMEMDEQSAAREAAKEDD